MAKFDPKQVVISIDGVAINSGEFAEADIEVNYGGATTEPKKGLAGGAWTNAIYSKQDELKFALIANTSSAYRLEKYNLNRKTVEVMVKDLNTNRKWTSPTAYVTEHDTLSLGKDSVLAFTVKPEGDFQLQS